MSTELIHYRIADNVILNSKIYNYDVMWETITGVPRYIFESAMKCKAFRQIVYPDLHSEIEIKYVKIGETRLLINDTIKDDANTWNMTAEIASCNWMKQQPKDVVNTRKNNLLCNDFFKYTQKELKELGFTDASKEIEYFELMKSQGKVLTDIDDGDYLINWYNPELSWFIIV